MSLPAALSTCTLTLGPYVGLDGAPAMAGRRASVRTSTVVRDRTTGEVLLPRPLVVTLDAQARASVVLPHTDCPGVDPTGWTYELTWEQRRVSDPAPLVFALPRALGAAADLDLLEPSPLVPPVHVPVIAGPPGPPGPPGSSAALVHRQTTAAASWSITHGFARPACVEVYVAGERVIPDVRSTDTDVLVLWPAPTAGVAVLT